jgi:CRP-like cAMP-binding protein
MADGELEHPRQDADAVVFAHAVRAISPLPDAEIAAALAFARPRELARGEHFLRAGEPATAAAIVIRGLVREYFITPDGTERTKAFVVEGQPTGSLADLLRGAPSTSFIVAEEPTRLLCATLAQCLALAERSEPWRAYSDAVMRRILLLKAEREYELLSLDAQSRYALFAQRYPGIETRVAGRHIASYLGITPVHLSRLRRRR